MALKRRSWNDGQVIVLEHVSALLKGNPLGDPHVRKLAVWHALMNLCMAATYDPDPRSPNGFRLPFNLETGEVIPERWRAWQKHDPIRLVMRSRKNLRSLRGIYLDCGSRDQYHIQYGMRILSKRLQQAGIAHRYEEFDDDHSDIDYRMDVSLPFLSRALR
jgi:hypothetical protein